MLGFLGWIGIVVQVILFVRMFGMGEPGVFMWVLIVLVSVLTVPLFLAGVIMDQARKLCLAGLAFYVLVAGGMIVMVLVHG
jgi:hypothetical protein